MRSRDRILSTLEAAYREAFDRAAEEGSEDRMQELDFRFQRDQVFLEAILDVRHLVSELLQASEPPGEDEPSLLEKAQKLRRITKLR